MKKLLIVLFIGFGIYGLIKIHPNLITSLAQQEAQPDQLLSNAYKNQESNLQLTGTGEVLRILPDDDEGSRHQKFIIRLSSGQTLLISHNIDLAPRIDSINEGDTVEFFGEYEWNAKGGVVHWTHHDPSGRHEDGWLRHKGQVYE